MRDHRRMHVVTSDPLAALELLAGNDREEAECQWLQDTLAWLKSYPPGSRTARLRHLAEGLAAPPALAQFQRVWEKSFAPKLFSEAGLPEATSLPRELIGRLKKRLLPHGQDEIDLYTALHTVEPDDDDAEWIAALDPRDALEWSRILAPASADFLIALRLLAIRASAIGLSRGIMQMMPHRFETESPFFGLSSAVAHYSESPRSPESREALAEAILDCRISAGLSIARLEERGVSSDLVFRLDLVISQLERMELLLRVASGQEDGRRLAALMVRSFAEERGIHSLLRNSVNRVARQVVTHTGKSGEHYIAASAAEWRRMGLGSLGAGALTAFTALFKYMLTSMALAPLWLGVAHSLNYTASFVLMQALGWSLASKMPSMTAAALSSAMEKEDGMHTEVELVAAITRTQSIVVAGNLLGAIPVSILVDLFLQWKNGNPFLTHEAALHGIESMHLLHSWTVPFAAMTGGFLWLSSLAAGWTANWMALNRLPQGIERSQRLRGLIGEEGAHDLAHIFDHHLSGVVGYVCLGLLLGLLPLVSVFAGVPIEVRHITLASASLAYDVSALAWSHAIPAAELTWAILGLAATGLLNFSVSFALGLWLAMRARHLPTSGRRKLVATLLQELRRHPARFLWRHPEPAAHCTHSV